MVLFNRNIKITPPPLCVCVNGKMKLLGSSFTSANSSSDTDKFLFETLLLNYQNKLKYHVDRGMNLLIMLDEYMNI